MLGLSGGFAHEQNGGGGSNGVSDADESFLGNVASARTGEGEDTGTKEGKRQTNPVRGLAMRVHADNDGDRGTERGDLGKGEVHENDPALDDVHTEIGVYSGEDQARDKRRE